MPDLSEKVFVITGGNGGIGLGRLKVLLRLAGRSLFGLVMKRRMTMQLKF